MQSNDNDDTERSDKESHEAKVRYNERPMTFFFFVESTVLFYFYESDT
jgi:hypothetical protein